MQRLIVPLVLIFLMYNTGFIYKIGDITGTTDLLVKYGWIRGDEFDPIRVGVFIILAPVVLLIPRFVYEVINIYVTRLKRLKQKTNGTRR